jgi:hypothetical protein
MKTDALIRLGADIVGAIVLAGLIVGTLKGWQ